MMMMIRSLTTSLPYPFQILLVFILSIASISLLGRILSSRTKTKDRSRQLPPGPRGWPILGNLPELYMTLPRSKYFHLAMKELKTDIACFNFAGVRAVTINSHEIAREAFRERDADLADRPNLFTMETIGDNYKSMGISPYGEQFMKMKRVITTELMSVKTLNMLVAARTIEADNLVAYVHSMYQRSEMVDVRELSRVYGYATTMRMLFGRRHVTQENIFSDDGRLGKAEKHHLEAIYNTLYCLPGFSPADYLEKWFKGWNIDGQDDRVTVNCNIVRSYNNPIIDERIELWRAKGGKPAVEDWLDIFITLKDQNGNYVVTPNEMKAQCVEFCIAAIDNPANNMEWTLAEMLNNHEILKKALKELDEVVGKDRLVQESDIPNLTFLKACCRETFRIHPSTHYVPTHVARQDTTLGGYFIPQGSHVHVCRPGLGRNPKIWKDPLVYKPERHLQGDGITKEVTLVEKEMRFVSFSTGRRGCIGVKVGTVMMVMMLARFLQGFNWKLHQDFGPLSLEEDDALLLMAKPLLLSVEPRLAPNLYPKFRP
ncbi:PREDICTED: dihomomethionine N-hydroxylase-like [Camelina sativa]|uniref:Dihomomethionine N-hydroxylase-like n=1 Tax=Camelina sativa TaxID=90675 RepID=A0ABM0VXV8_CAMSA|nr:PREDICTED: dihomomethionine N-hydroxylase-like [Camelina sativa]